MEMNRIDLESIQSINKIRFTTLLESKLSSENHEMVTKERLSQEPKNELSRDELDKVLNQANQYTLGENAQFEFKIHEGTGRTLVRLVNIESGETIKEIPPQKMLDIVASIWDAMGINVDIKE
ncbi:flagellar protein FlaG [Carnobacterium antarcticum]|uniref:Flagellar protein FlaG n=1 Tax=Carnobacterium antarcticum TaxID=2126436 RepID=A0ABW4NLA7_9LACT|nr:flagellar protein FlaG [Carnobacterium sp. CP1]ALV22052.1 Flagellin [Carnobacterium sp. CP1]